MKYEFDVCDSELFVLETLRPGYKVPENFLHVQSISVPGYFANSAKQKLRVGVIRQPRLLEWERQYQIPYHVDLVWQTPSSYLTGTFRVILYAKDHAMIWRLSMGGVSV